ncbi:hypothetical protein PMW_172 [Pseudomonas phage phiPMW]|uniref:Uncharacterized protein n=1 Tax=Pseudomonas phage phiPMW TaxID=1815582 RepID=A0A1S5R1L6_9CAUD|nr:hypothetical protein FDG97_gp178 [Pseudomonas phage phiPMW]ANA49297.1 hypothetical protein PMW_172 [Pseudomonas phage phiPMW]
MRYGTKQATVCNGGKMAKSAYAQGWSCAPQGSRVPLLPKNINKPFLQRLKEWIKS